MKLATYQFKTLLNSGIKDAKSILFYGEEDLFVIEKVHTFLQGALKTKLSETLSIDAEKVLSKEVFLSDLLKERTLFEEEKKTIWLQRASEKTLPFIKEFLEDDHCSFFIVTADKYLKPSSKMRQYYEEERSLLSMGCFAPTLEDIKQKLGDIFRRENKTITPNLLTKLSEIFVRSPLVLEGEIEKLLTYTLSKSDILEQDIESCLSVNEVLGYDDLIDAFFDQNQKKTLHFFQVQLAEGGSSIGVLRTLIFNTRRLYALKCAQTEGKPIDQALMMVTPPIFSHQKDKVKRFLEKWPVKALESLLDSLIQVETFCKTSGDLANNVFEKVLLDFSKSRTH